MIMVEAVLFWFELLAVAVFALTGAIVAARNKMDPVAFVILATITGIGGGTIRDAVLATPAFWLSDPLDLLVCATVAILVFLSRATFVELERQRGPLRVLPWADALGLALFAVAGTERALLAGAHPIAAVVLGTITASFGGIVRDVIIGKTTLIATREIYITAAFLAAVVYIVAFKLTGLGVAAALLGFAAGFGLRAGAIVFGWSLPTVESWHWRK
jgi:uncharacterized membrane protein YeiH